MIGDALLQVLLLHFNRFLPSLESSPSSMSSSATGGGGMMVTLLFRTTFPGALPEPGTISEDFRGRLSVLVVVSTTSITTGFLADFFSCDGKASSFSSKTFILLLSTTFVITFQAITIAYYVSTCILTLNKTSHLCYFNLSCSSLLKKTRWLRSPNK